MNPSFRIPPFLQESANGKILYCSFSGGSDSLALLLLLEKWKQDGGYTLKAVHFEHGFRGKDSLADAEFCRDLCEKRKIPFQCISLDVPRNRRKGEGEEAAARRLRLEAWRKIISRPQEEYIVLGHHRGDVTENMLLRLFRGSNASGLAAMRSCTRIGELVFLRPLLPFSKKELSDFLMSQGIRKWCQDSTNDENIYGRNFLRNTVLPVIAKEFPFAEKGIAASSAAMECDADYLEKTAGKDYREFAGSEFAAEKIAGLHDAVLIRVLRLFLREKTGRDLIPDKALLLRLRSALHHGGTEPVLLPVPDLPDFFLAIVSGYVRLVPKEKKETEEKILLQQEDCRTGFRKTFSSGGKEYQLEVIPADRSGLHNGFLFDAEDLKFPLTCSSWKNGEKMIPFGRKNPVLLKKLFTDAKIGSMDRDAFPVIRDGVGNLLCIAGLRRSSFAPVDADSRTVVRICSIEK